jgi:predicted nucleic acid-binding protein
VLLYCDSSALVKLVVNEPESDALESWLATQPEPALISSVVARTEVIRAIGRSDPSAVTPAQELLEAVSVVELDAALADEAAGLQPALMRTIDALHVASALRISEALGVLVSYDDRMLAAAREHGLTAASPGRSASA